jgi:haloalkane dehalogenase
LTPEVSRASVAGNHVGRILVTILRTPDERFEVLVDYPFAPHYLDVDGGPLGRLRVHYVDEGPRDGPVVLLMHGEPSWSYLYRKMIPPLAAAGARVLAPDLVGFGRSDKPSAVADYSYARHVDWMMQWLHAVNPREVTLFCQDWGGLVGLRLVAAEPGRFARVVASNTFLPTGDRAPSDAFLAWRKFSQEVPEFPAGGIIKGGTARGIGNDVRAAYDAPYPDECYKAGARAFPMLVPISPDDPEAEANRVAWRTLEAFNRPFLTLFGDSDPVTAGADRVLQSRIPGAVGQPHRTIARAGHFIQEDAGEELAAEIVRFIGLGQNALDSVGGGP